MRHKMTCLPRHHVIMCTLLNHNQVNSVKGCVNLAPPFPGFIFPPLLDAYELEAQSGHYFAGISGTPC